MSNNLIREALRGIVSAIDGMDGRKPEHVEHAIANAKFALATPAAEPGADKMAPVCWMIQDDAGDLRKAKPGAQGSFPVYRASRAAAVPEPDHEFTDWARAALLWVLWHHQGASSPEGQPIRYALGMGAFERLTTEQIAEAKRWAELVPQFVFDKAASPTVLPSQEPARWKLVPVKATPSMVDVGGNIEVPCGWENTNIGCIASEVWDAMLAVAPDHHGGEC